MRFIFAFALRTHAMRLLLGAASWVVLWLSLPESLAGRLWWGALAALAAPWLVLGRTQRRRREGWASVNLSARALPLYAAESLAPALILLGGAWLVALGHWAPALVMLLWAGALTALADLLDRCRLAPGLVWLTCFTVGLAVLTAPWWVAPWYGQAEAPQLASWVMNLHPVGAALSAAQLPLLTDEIFYRWTLSGAVVAHPMPWTKGAILYGALGVAAWGLSAFAPRLMLRKGERA